MRGKEHLPKRANKKSGARMARRTAELSSLIFRPMVIFGSRKNSKLLISNMHSIFEKKFDEHSCIRLKSFRHRNTGIKFWNAIKQKYNAATLQVKK
jgi:hypothetical protein